MYLKCLLSVKNFVTSKKKIEHTCSYLFCRNRIYFNSAYRMVVRATKNSRTRECVSFLMDFLKLILEPGTRKFRGRASLLFLV